MSILPVWYHSEFCREKVKLCLCCNAQRPGKLASMPSILHRPAQPEMILGIAGGDGEGEAAPVEQSGDLGGWAAPQAALQRFGGGEMGSRRQPLSHQIGQGAEQRR